MTDWLYLRHEETGGETRIPDDADVLAAQQARGWKVVDPPEDVPFVPPKVNIEADESVDIFGNQWVELVHPDIEARHTFPDNAAALHGALEAGWVLPNKDGSIPKRATVARRRATQESGADGSGESTDRPDKAATDNQEG